MFGYEAPITLLMGEINFQAEKMTEALCTMRLMGLLQTSRSLVYLRSESTEKASWFICGDNTACQLFKHFTQARWMRLQQSTMCEIILTELKTHSGRTDTVVKMFSSLPRRLYQVPCKLNTTDLYIYEHEKDWYLRWKHLTRCSTCIPERFRSPRLCGDENENMQVTKLNLWKRQDHFCFGCTICKNV